MCQQSGIIFGSLDCKYGISNMGIHRKSCDCQTIHEAMHEALSLRVCSAGCQTVRSYVKSTFVGVP
jgi:hypothetical protein